MTDNGVRALAERLSSTKGRIGQHRTFEQRAAAILANGAVFLPDGQWDDPAMDGTEGAHPAWWRGNDRGWDQALAAARGAGASPRDNERLRRIEAAARRIADDHRQGYEPSIGAMGALFRALQPEGSAGTRCPSCDSGKREHRGFAAGDDPAFRCEDDWHAATEGSARDGG